MNIYNTSSKSLIDPKKMANVITSALEELKAVPDLKDCGDIFKMITGCSGILEENFETYYKEADACGDKNIIITSYISDVTKKHSDRITPTMSLKFKKLLSVIDKKSKGKNIREDKEIKEVINVVDNIVSRVAEDEE